MSARASVSDPAHEEATEPASFAHLTCPETDGRTALCGWRLKGIPADDDDEICVVCNDLGNGICPFCGLDCTP